MSPPIISSSNQKSLPALLLLSLLLIAPSNRFTTNSHSEGLPSSSPFLCEAVKIYKPDQSILLLLKSRWPRFLYANSWIAGADCSDNGLGLAWEGVACDQRSGAVTGLDLTIARIKGKIPPAIGNLTALTSLELRFNTLRGQLPRSIGRLSRLQKLTISDNGPGMRENIPATLSRLTNLVLLDLSYNRFSGPIPRFILNGTLQKLEALELSRNRLTGSIPGEKLGSLSALYYFSVGDNGLTGSIPTGIGKLRALEYLNIRNNRLEGALPSSLTACTGLRTLAAGTNRLGGPLPVNTLLQLPKLSELSLERNGFIVTSLAPLANLPLRDIDLSHNKVARRILATLGQMKNIHYLNLAGNKLTGPVPSYLLANQPDLHGLDLSFNRLSGSFPWTAVRGAPELVRLDIQNNMLSGTISDDSFTGLRMSSMNISNNFFAGRLPDFKSPIREFELDVRGNFFSGSPEIRAWGQRACPIEGVTGPTDDLKYLTVARNCLSGVPDCNVRPSQRRPASCAAFCGVNGKLGACGGHGTCRPKLVGGKVRWRFSCECNKGYALKPGNRFLCVPTAAARAAKVLKP